MKSVWQIILLLALVHAISAIGFVGWLAGTGRLNRQRVVDVRDLFAKSISQAEVEAKEKARQEEEKRQADLRMQRLGSAGGPVASTTGRLAEDRKRAEAILARIDLDREELKSLGRNLELSQKNVRRLYEELRIKQEAFAKMLDKKKRQIDDQSFRKTVALYNQLPSKQVKKMFIELLDSSKGEQVVTYLEAMQPRKAAGVLREFKTSAEVTRAVELTERLRARGSDLAKQLENLS